MEKLCEPEQINAKRTDATSDKNDALEIQQVNEECAQESEPAGKTDCLGLQERREAKESLLVAENGVMPTSRKHLLTKKGKLLQTQKRQEWSLIY